MVGYQHSMRDETTKKQKKKILQLQNHVRKMNDE